MRRIFVFLGMLFVLLSPPIGRASERIGITEHRDEKGKNTYYSTSPELLSRSPSWDLTGNPPLSIEAAVTKAKEWIRTRYPSFIPEEVVNISLGRIYEPEIGNRWYYTVSLQARTTTDGVDTEKFFSVIVLLDGSVVEPSDSK